MSHDDELLEQMARLAQPAPASSIEEWVADDWFNAFKRSGQAAFYDLPTGRRRR